MRGGASGSPRKEQMNVWQKLGIIDALLSRSAPPLCPRVRRQPAPDARGAVGKDVVLVSQSAIFRNDCTAHAPIANSVSKILPSIRLSAAAAVPLKLQRGQLSCRRFAPQRPFVSRLLSLPSFLPSALPQSSRVASSHRGPPGEAGRAGQAEPNLISGHQAGSLSQSVSLSVAKKPI